MSNISKMRELFWFKKKELNYMESGLAKTKSILGHDTIYQIIQSHDNTIKVTIDENFLRKCRIVMTTDTVDIFSPKELEVWYDFTMYSSDNNAAITIRPEVAEAISRDLFSIFLDEPIEKFGKNTIILAEQGENDYGSENDKRVYYITQTE